MTFQAHETYDEFIIIYLWRNITMNNTSYMYHYPNPYYNYVPMRNCENMWGPGYWNMSNTAGYTNQFYPYPNTQRNTGPILNDHGGEPFVVDINQAARKNNAYRTVIWTGNYLQVTLMSIDVGDNIGLEAHPNADQFSYIVEGQGLVQMGESKNHLSFIRHASDNSAFIVPSGTWHNVTNTGNTPLKLYTIYAPPMHPFGAFEKTKADAEAAEG